jgi:hypothetical protein
MDGWTQKWFALTLAMVATVAMALAPQVTFASAEDIVEKTRDAYVKEAEPICKTNVVANRRIFKGAKQEVKDGKLKLASTHFFHAATEFGKTIGQLRAISPPAADKAKIEEWLGFLRDDKTLILSIAHALASEDKHRAQSLSLELNRTSNRANNAVLSFGFNYCRIEPSRFG